MNEKKICKICGEEIHKHVIKEGARFHVTSYSLVRRNGKEHSISTCSDPLCEHNHGKRVGQCGDPEVIKQKKIKKSGIVTTLSFNKSRGIPIDEFCALERIVTKKHGEGVMISVQDKNGHMHLTKNKKHLGYIDINTGSLIWDEGENA